MAAIPQDLLDRIRTLERQVRELTGRAQMRPALNRISHGEVSIGEGGSFAVYPPGAEKATFQVGEWPDGSFGAALRRRDGMTALTLEGDGSESGMLRIWNRDRATRSVLIMDDFYSDSHLGRPWMPTPLYPTADQRTSATDYRTGWCGRFNVHNAVLYMHVITSAGAGGGQSRVKLMHPSGEVTVAEWDLDPNAWTRKYVTYPLHRIPFLDEVEVIIDHRCKTGGSSVETRLLNACTRNTRTEDERPEPPPTPVPALSPPAPNPTAAPEPAPTPGLHRVDH